jgi:hypothetical protein
MTLKRKQRHTNDAVPSIHYNQIKSEEAFNDNVLLIIVINRRLLWFAVNTELSKGIITIISLIHRKIHIRTALDLIGIVEVKV